MIIFNEAQTLAYSTNFNYLGNAFNYSNTSNLVIKGRFQSDQTTEDVPTTYFGMAYVNSSGVWVPFGGGTGITTGTMGSFSGLLSFENGNAYVSILAEEYNYENANILYNGVPLIYNGTQVTYNYGSDIEHSFSEIFGESEYSPLYDIWEEMENIQQSFQNFQEIYLNGVSVGIGRIKKISFPESKDPRVATYETEIEIFKEGNLFNLTGQNYQNIAIDSTFCKYVSNIGEGFDLKTDKDGVMSYNRSLSFDCIDPNFSGNIFVQKVKDFASGIIYNDPAFQISIAQYPSWYQNEGSRYFSETYDNIRGAYSFSERFQGPSSGEKYRWTNSISASFEGEGITSLSEKGSIVGVRKNILTSAYEGMAEVESSVSSRVNDFFSYYGDSCPDGLFLKSKNKTINTEAGVIDYSFDYSNDPFSNGCFEIEREITFDKSENGISTVSEKGSVKNTCEPTGEERLDAAISYFNTNISPYVPSRIFDCYLNNYSPSACSPSPEISGLRKINSEFTNSEYNGIFGYSYVYRDDKVSLINGCFLKTNEVSITDSIHNVSLNITPYSGEIAQFQNTSSLVEQRQTITVLSQCDDKTLDEYLDVAISDIGVPGGDTFYMSSADYTFDPDNSKLILNIGYNHTTGYRPYANYNV